MTVFSARLAVYPMKYMKSVVKTTSHGGLSISEWVLERKKNRLMLAFFKNSNQAICSQLIMDTLPILAPKKIYIL
jgi:hypothetical protein